MSMIRETFSMARAWDAKAPAREQIAEQNDADGRFDHICELAKMLELQVASPHRFMKQPDAEAEFKLTHYFIDTRITGTKEAMEYFKAMLDHKLPPPFEARVELPLWVVERQGGIHILVSCCFCPAAFATKTVTYRGTLRYTVEQNIFCPHCHTRIVQGKALAVIPTSEEQAAHFERLAKEQQA